VQQRPPQQGVWQQGVWQQGVWQGCLARRRAGPLVPGPPAWPWCPVARVQVLSGGCQSSTMSAVTMPNMPLGPSAWLSMWQWKAHTPGRVGLTSTV